MTRMASDASCLNPRTNMFQYIWMRREEQKVKLKINRETKLKCLCFVFWLTVRTIRTKVLSCVTHYLQTRCWALHFGMKKKCRCNYYFFLLYFILLHEVYVVSSRNFSSKYSSHKVVLFAYFFFIFSFGNRYIYILKQEVLS